MSPLRLHAARLVLAVAAPMLVFATCEAVGWLAGAPVLFDHPGYQSAARMDRCHSAGDAERYCTRDRVRARDGEYTIAFLGGSSVFGYPAGAPSFAHMTRRLLDRRSPRRYRAVNLGLYCKDTLYVRACAEGVVSEELDLLVIYTGHNDFAHWMGRFPRVAMFVEQNAWMLDVRDWLARTRTYSVLASLVRPPGVSALHYVSPPDDVLRAATRTILAAYEEHLTDVLDGAARAGVPVLLVTVVSNLHEYPVREPEWDAALAAQEEPDERAAWRAPFAAGVEAHRAGRWRDALESFRAARDVLPLGRAPSGVNEILRRLAAREGVELVDFERILEADAEADGALIGCNYFGGVEAVGAVKRRWCDQFHPARRTHRMLADAVTAAVLQRDAARSNAETAGPAGAQPARR